MHPTKISDRTLQKHKQLNNCTMQGATESHCCTDNASCQTACVVLVSTTVLCRALCIATSVDCRTGHSKQTLSHCGVPAELVLHSCGFKWMRGGRTRAGWPWPTVAHGGPRGSQFEMSANRLTGYSPTADVRTLCIAHCAMARYNRVSNGM